MQPIGILGNGNPRMQNQHQCLANAYRWFDQPSIDQNQMACHHLGIEGFGNLRWMAIACQTKSNQLCLVGLRLLMADHHQQKELPSLATPITTTWDSIIDCWLDAKRCCPKCKHHFGKESQMAFNQIPTSCCPKGNNKLWPTIIKVLAIKNGWPSFGLAIIGDDSLVGHKSVGHQNQKPTIWHLVGMP